MGAKGERCDPIVSETNPRGDMYAVGFGFSLVCRSCERKPARFQRYSIKREARSLRAVLSVSLDKRKVCFLFGESGWSFASVSLRQHPVEAIRGFV